jgi:RNA-directed DNA polymerase
MKLNKTNGHSHGLSGESIQDFERNLSTRISSISSKLINGEFEFSATRAVALLKSNGSYRPLQVPEIQDRLVSKAIALVLEDELEILLEGSNGVSFAYQKKLGIKEAIQ